MLEQPISSSAAPLGHSQAVVAFTVWQLATTYVEEQVVTTGLFSRKDETSHVHLDICRGIHC